MMRACSTLRAGGVLAGLLLVAVAPPAQGQSGPKPAQASAPQVIVAVHLRDPHFRITEAKFRVFYAQTEAKSVDVVGYDFGAAFSDELADTLAGDQRARWRLPAGDESIYLRSYFEEKASQGSLPASVEADRLLLVDVRQYGVLFHVVRRFYIYAELRMVERSTNRLLWKKNIRHFVKDKDKHSLEELSAESQKILKELLNRTIEGYCAEAKKAVAEKPI